MAPRARASQPARQPVDQSTGPHGAQRKVARRLGPGPMGHKARSQRRDPKKGPKEKAQREKERPKERPREKEKKGPNKGPKEAQKKRPKEKGTKERGP